MEIVTVTAQSVLIYRHTLFFEKAPKRPPIPIPLLLGGERPVPHAALWAEQSELGLQSREKASLEHPPGCQEGLTYHPKCEVLTQLHSAKLALLTLLKTSANSEIPCG